ncbi:hypothetical protein GCM10007304_43880 [Rhodococcoides trifolii]|uniref:Uncharacterized protein n=1 Tax=Rhodococcoides trifolii TaxID=908250 RepID=A0A917G6N1_9NOCA|nr:hypothetical protein [Rhodococcus trifolii]GGG25271.1 hypothetical protein GCM10007304_43880 [Rhodococcus trifolii]
MTTVGMTKATAAAKSRAGDDPSSKAGRGSAKTSGTAAESVVLTYELADKHLTASLVDGGDGSQRGDARTMDLEDLSPEQIGLTVPMLWELLDRAKVKPGTVVVLGDVNTATVSPILELALGVPVIAPGVSAGKGSDMKKPTMPKADAPVAAAVTRPVPAKRLAPKSKTVKPASAAADSTEATAAVVAVPGKPVPTTAKTVAAKTVPPKTAESKTVESKTVDSKLVAGKPAAAAVAAGTAAGTAAVAAKKVDITKPASATGAKSPGTAADVTDPPTEEMAVVTPVAPPYAFADADVTAPVPAVAAVPPSSTPASPASASGGKGRRGLVLAAAATAVVLAGGIGAALALNNGGSESVPGPTPSAATQEAAPAAPSAAPSAELPSSAAASAPAAVVPAPAAVPPPAAPVASAAPPVASAPVDTSGWTNSAPPAWTPNRVPAAQPPATQAPVAPAPQSSSTYVPPPQFTVPVPVPDPNNPNATPQELQDKAWADHWERTREYFEQQGG